MVESTHNGGDPNIVVYDADVERDSKKSGLTLKDFPHKEHPVLLWACKEYAVRLLTQNAFPSFELDFKFQIESFNAATDRYKDKVIHTYPVTERHLSYVSFSGALIPTLTDFRLEVEHQQCEGR